MEVNLACLRGYLMALKSFLQRQGNQVEWGGHAMTREGIVESLDCDSMMKELVSGAFS